ncbi:alpha-1,3-mannosyl-glycoprotein 2-beta-N-acetylglucosaminyltransferase b [Pristis pectinata]|uniref:alpha-1,3-mannosyl-glycoprotein 2-beta-N-acetylglucosaminyltransferase b n=1 Tax=Pristis pectinata TaxID=685728 RepID=UPI00223CA658|nr:alpha-1,3-mannosyl-glycoprotein 2-beta-N-acetylglucosaminyltransferase b [Pristis pectinata]XP_051899905.1 alpha-1,3-mannosyl-glycoprotein 2-beta-N-acetylglucosaminyltransferase b [Pristis pectinata]XP_051899906.1 alpha-1,3-mannosyl-glycoprotein 2-beta-N-acetylglucosaminyltransferase b [Pristis pectinata]XP_051899907.1 alpha-1,3-mannosyl-glycoprotein 2-beta-N-acetylglucosaminyltransferase b [Pristis pectinata]XP_051899908.1 alpha-1,3-mannosyl-glycoprotein 2-beta-N-acetylglucosaminyltransfera
MMLRRSNVVVWGVLLFIAWNLLLLLFLLARPPAGGGSPDPEELTRQVVRVAEEVEQELEVQQQLLHQIQEHQSLWRQGKGEEQHPAAPPPPPTPDHHRPPPQDSPLPVLVIGCDRPTIRRCLDKLLHHRPSKELYPILVSQDCGHEETARVIASYGDQLMHIRQPDLSDLPVPPEHRKFQGYYKISRHYRWALNQVFRTFKYSAVVVVEDDLEVAPDFFEYFRALLPLLRADPSLWCASAWNDNGKEQMVETGRPETLYRTDFFPGLGWMLLKSTWEELEPNWPGAFWDDWMRHPAQRQGRSCIRPELSRTITFGRKGVSNGQFFDQHLKFIKLSDRFVPFTRLDLSYLRKERYDPAFTRQVYGAPALRVDELQRNERAELGAVRVQYSTRDAFKAFAKALGVMDDLKSGVPRAGYRGVVTFMYRGRRVYLAPPKDWSGYDPS